MSEKLQRYLDEIRRAATCGAGSPTGAGGPPISVPNPGRLTAPSPPQRGVTVPALLIRQCECGVLLRVRYLTEVKKYTYQCGQCAREIELIGEVLDILVCKVQPASVRREWVKVPSSRIIEST